MDGTPSIRWTYKRKDHPISHPHWWVMSLMISSSNGNIFRVTGHLCREFTGPGEFQHKGQWRGALMFSLICVWINSWVNNCEASDLKSYIARYDITVMFWEYMMTSWCRNVFHISGPLWGKSTDHWWISDEGPIMWSFDGFSVVSLNEIWNSDFKWHVTHVISQ